MRNDYDLCVQILFFKLFRQIFHLWKRSCSCRIGAWHQNIEKYRNIVAISSRGYEALILELLVVHRRLLGKRKKMFYEISEDACPPG